MKRILLALLLLTVVFTPCFAQGAAEENTNKIVVASDIAYPPMEFIDENGDEVGFDIDMLRAIEAVSDLEIEIRNTAWDGIFAGLLNGQYDAICSAVSITDERKKTMDFSDVYFNTAQALIVKTETTSVTTLQDLVDQNLKVGVQIGTTGALALDDYDFDESQIKEFDTTPYAVADMMNGNLDAVVCDAIVANDFIIDNDAYSGKLKRVGDYFNEDPYGIAIQKGNTELVEKINAALAILKENGTLDDLYKKWLQ